jgi:N-formylglutamate amidohydrolase
VILPLVALAAPHFTAAEILTPPSHCQPSAVVLSSPHAGRVYPAEFIAASIADVTALRGLEDFGVDQLIGSVRDHGITCINNQISRAYIDVIGQLMRLITPCLPRHQPRPIPPPHHHAMFGLVMGYCRA